MAPAPDLDPDTTLHFISLQHTTQGLNTLGLTPKHKSRFMATDKSVCKEGKNNSRPKSVHSGADLDYNKAQQSFKKKNLFFA